MYPHYKNRLLILAFLLTGLFAGSSFTAKGGTLVSNIYMLQQDQIPAALKKFNPTIVFVIYRGPLIRSSWKSQFFRGDTITNLKKFIDSTNGVSAYRLLFFTPKKMDSVWQTDKNYVLTDKVYPAGNGLLKILSYSNNRVTDQFTFNYALKYRDKKLPVPNIVTLLSKVEVYNVSDRHNYSAAAAWVLSIGIDDYKGMKFGSCKTDAEEYNLFFKKQYTALGYDPKDYHEFLLTGSNATKAAIINALKEIAAGAAPNDYFVFNFAGYTQVVSLDSLKFNTYFFPSDSTVDAKEIRKGGKTSMQEINDKLISLKVLQEYIQLIRSKNQLFISEAGQSEKFKSEFIKTMMQSSPAISAMLNVNRVIIAPNGLGMEMMTPEGKLAGIIAYNITKLDSAFNIYELFSTDHRSDAIAANLLTRFSQKSPGYVDIFFEKKFLQQYHDVFGDDDNKTRGGGTINKQIQKSALAGNRHALVIGTDNYKGKGWDKLNNPIYDASEIAGILREYYDYEVQLLKDPSMDNIYSSIREYYKSLQPDDKLIIYIAGHGDYDRDLLDDGFIVCNDSKSVEDDPLRNSYIQHTKLKKMINKIPAKQILVLLDICHGGVFDDEVRNDPTSRITNRNVLELLRTNSSYTVRKVLSSVGLESAFDGKAGKHSPFAAYLINILNAKGGMEGIVTLSDIHALLQKASLNETATLKISPHLADFGANDPLGEFILIPAETKDK